MHFKKEVAFVRKAISLLFFLTSLVIVMSAVVVGDTLRARQTRKMRDPFPP